MADVSKGQERPVKQHHHAKEQKEDPNACDHQTHLFGSKILSSANVIEEKERGFALTLPFRESVSHPEGLCVVCCVLCVVFCVCVMMKQKR